MSTINKSAKFYVEQYGIPESHAKNMALFISRFKNSGLLEIRNIHHFELPLKAGKRFANLNRCSLYLSLWTQNMMDERSVLSAIYCPRWNDIYVDIIFSDFSTKMRLSEFIKSPLIDRMGKKTRARMKEVGEAFYG